MGRRERELDPTSGPVARFAHELRALRQAAGPLTYRAMAAKAHYSAASLAEAAAGERLPTLPVALAYARACGGDEAEWEQRWQAAEQEARERAAAEDDPDAAPYLGLARFEPDDHARYFGRDRLVERLAALVRRAPLAVLVGPSGSGKSSLLRAGLIPRLRGASDPGDRPGALRILTPGARPAHTHAPILAPENLPPATVVIVDQFEEVFTLCADPAERTRFLDLLVDAAHAGSGARVLVSVRADFYGRLTEHRPLSDAARESTLLVGPMNPDELREVIVKPAAAAGHTVERALTARLVAEADTEPGALPLLSHALLETWRRRHGRTLSEAAYEAAGGLHGAIARTAEDCYAPLTPDERETARHLLLRLVTPGQGTPDTRRPADRAELLAARPEHAPLVLERLAGARLVTLSEHTVDLAHEALLSAWPRLRGWIEEDREHLRQQRLLTQAAADWQALDRDPGALYRGVRLATAEEHFAGGAGLTPLEGAFLAAALTARGRSRRRRTTRAGALAVLLVLALVAGTIAWQQTRDGERRRVEETARRTAATAESLRRADPATAMRLALAAWHTADLPETRSAVAGAAAQRELDSFTDPDNGAGTMRHLSADGRTMVSVGAREVAWWDVATHRRTARMPGLGRAVFDAVAPRAVSRWYPVYQNDPATWQAVVRDLTTGRPGRVVDPARAGTEMGPSGRSAIFYDRPEGTGAGPLTIRIRDMASGRLLLRLPGGTAPSLLTEPVSTSMEYGKDGRIAEMPDVTLSADDRIAALCTGGRRVQLWDVPSRRRLHTPWAPVLTARQCLDERLDFTADGRRLTFRDAEGLRTWEIASGRQLPRILMKDLQEARYSDDGTLLAAADTTRLMVWDLRRSDRPVLTYPLQGDWVSALSIDPDAGTLRVLTGPRWAWGSTVRTLAIGDLRAPGRTGPSFETAAFAPDGRTLATATVEGATVTFRLQETGTPARSPRELPRIPCRRTPEPREPRPCLPLLAFTADGRTLAYGVTASTGRKRPPLQLAYWDLARRRVAERQAVSLDMNVPVGAMAFTPDGGSLVLTGTPLIGHTWFWDRRLGKIVRKVPNVSGSVVAVHPDGDRFVTGQGYVGAYPSGRADPDTSGPGELWALLFSPDGSSFAAGETNGRVQLWDGRLRRRLGILMPPASEPAPDPSPVIALAFSPDARLLAAANGDGAVQLWDTTTRRPLGIPLPTSGDTVAALAFSADGRTLHTAGTSGLRSYPVDTGRAAETVCRRAGRGLSRGEWEDRLPGIPYRESCPPS